MPQTCALNDVLASVTCAIPPTHPAPEYGTVAEDGTVGWEIGELNLGRPDLAVLLLILLACLCSSSWCQQDHAHVRGRLLLP
jgi:hypothetical protein